MSNLLKLKQESRKNVFDDLYTPKGVTKPLIEFLEEKVQNILMLLGLYFTTTLGKENYILSIMKRND